MTYPAFDDFSKQIGHEIRRGYAIWRVYMALQPPVLHFKQARDVKVDALVEELRMGRRQVIRALDWLEQQGYVEADGRDRRRVRSLTLSFARDPAA